MNDFEPSVEFIQASEAILMCYQKLEQNQSNLVHELLNGDDAFYQWQHYPENDVADHKTHSQYYYHCHFGHDKERFTEHGHFHLFIREPGIPEKYKPIAVSNQYTEDKSDDLCHLICISMNKLGYPCGFFTVNHWVTRGIWYEADAVCAMLDLFKINHDKPSAFVNLWINAIVELYKPQLKQLIYKRDEIIQQWKCDNHTEDVFNDESLEVTSFLPIG